MRSLHICRIELLLQRSVENYFIVFQNVKTLLLSVCTASLQNLPAQGWSVAMSANRIQIIE